MAQIYVFVIRNFDEQILRNFWEILISRNYKLLQKVMSLRHNWNDEALKVSDRDQNVEVWYMFSLC